MSHVSLQLKVKLEGLSNVPSAAAFRHQYSKMLGRLKVEKFVEGSSVVSGI